MPKSFGPAMGIVMQVLAEAGKPLSGPEIIERVEALGYPSNDPRRMVNNVVYRLRSDDLIIISGTTKSRTYTLAPGARRFVVTDMPARRNFVKDFLAMSTPQTAKELEREYARRTGVEEHPFAMRSALLALARVHIVVNANRRAGTKPAKWRLVKHNHQIHVLDISNKWPWPKIRDAVAKAKEDYPGARIYYSAKELIWVAEVGV